jgi:hypothetical protein
MWSMWCVCWGWRNSWTSGYKSYSITRWQHSAWFALGMKKRQMKDDLERRALFHMVIDEQVVFDYGFSPYITTKSVLPLEAQTTSAAHGNTCNRCSLWELHETDKCSADKMRCFYFWSWRYIPCIRGDADKSLARPTSRFRRTESIVSLDRGVCSCAELQVFPCYRGWKEACQATRAISTT